MREEPLAHLAEKHRSRRPRGRYGKLQSDDSTATGQEIGRAGGKGRKGSWSWGRRNTSGEEAGEHVKTETGEEVKVTNFAELAMAEVRCKLQHPKPVRGSEMKRLVSLCKTRAGAALRSVSGSKGSE